MTEYRHGTKDTLAWFSKAKPEPTEKDLSTQIGVHFEEVGEMLENLTFTDQNVSNQAMRTLDEINRLAEMCKAGTVVKILQEDRIEVLDALCDQIVTAVGVGHQAGMQIVDALNEVNRSNWSKFDSNGNPVFDSNRKIIKGNDYSKPNLSNFI